MKTKNVILTIVITLFMALLAGCDDSYDSSSNNDSLVQKETTPVTISIEEAYAIAKSKVPNAIHNNYFMKNATNYKITDYEYLGNDSSDSTYEFEFFGLWYEFDKYDDLINDGKFRVRIDVDFNGKIRYYDGWTN